MSGTKLTEFRSNTCQSLITAFYTYIDVLVRINKHEIAKEICDYVVSTGPNNFQYQFNSKKAWLISISGRA